MQAKTPEVRARMSGVGGLLKHLEVRIRGQIWGVYLEQPA